jgi:hypothetical protein
VADINFGSGATNGVINTGQMTSTFVAQPKPGAFDPDMGFGYQPSGMQQSFSFVSVEDLANLPDQLWAQGDMKGSIELLELAKAGGYSSWQEAIANAALDPKKNERGFMDFLTEQAQKYEALGIDRGGDGAYNGPTTTTYTSTDQSSVSEAGGDINTVFQQEMGRMATEQEIKLYQKLLNAQQRNSPEVSVVNRSEGGQATQSQTTSGTGGFDARRFAQEFVRSRPEFAETYAGTKFMDVLDSFISQPNALDQMIGQ